MIQLSMVSIVLILFGAYISISNLDILIKQYKGIHTPSIITFFGGILLTIGFSLNSIEMIRYFCYIGLFLDYGCAPYVIFISIYLLQEHNKFKNTNKTITIGIKTDTFDAELTLYQCDEAILKYEMHDGLSSGSTLFIVEWISTSQAIICTNDSFLRINNINNTWLITQARDTQIGVYSLNSINA